MNSSHFGLFINCYVLGWVIRAVLSRVLSIPPVAMYRIHVANASITRVRTDRLRGFTLLSHGRLA